MRVDHDIRQWQRLACDEFFKRAGANGRPSNCISPSQPANKPAIQAMVVVLPAPFGPIKPKFSPGKMQNVAELTARRDLALEWYGQLEAPRKHLFTFENSAHSVAQEQFVAFRQILLETILPETYAPQSKALDSGG